MNPQTGRCSVDVDDAVRESRVESEREAPIEGWDACTYGLLLLRPTVALARAPHGAHRPSGARLMRYGAGVCTVTD